MTRRHALLVLFTAAAAAAATFIWLEWPHDDPARVSVEEAVRSFRAQGSESTGDRAGIGPAPGVYRYATQGAETGDASFFSASHSYDGVSTVTVSAGGCGETERWEVLAQRWNETEVCSRPAGEEPWAATEFHEFFGNEQEDVFSCRGDSPRRPPFEPVSKPFTIRCTSPDSTVLSTLRVRDLAPVEVDGRKYQAVHTVTRSVLKGETNGTTRSEDWRRRSDGLLLRRRVAAKASTDAAGGTLYTEHYTITLIDPRPRR
jgi:hypothetical protein